MTKFLQTVKSGQRTLIRVTGARGGAGGSFTLREDVIVTNNETNLRRNERNRNCGLGLGEPHASVWESR